MQKRMSKTNVEWLAETADSRPLTLEKLKIIGQLGLKDVAPLVKEEA
jgi:hypothetical protein